MSLLGRAQPPPIAVEILGLLVGGLVAAQLATLALSVLLPPPPPPEYRLSDIASTLRGGPLSRPDLPPLERALQIRPPDPHSPGWQVSETSRRDLAGALGVSPDDVRLLFYSPPPFAGAEPRAGHAEREAARPRIVEANLFALLLMAPPPGGGGPGGPGAGLGGPGGSGNPTGPSGGRTSRGPGGGLQGGSSGRGPGGSGGAPQSFDPPVAPVAQGAPDGGPVGSSAGASLGTLGAGGLGRSGYGGPAGRASSPDGPIQTAPFGGFSSGGAPGRGVVPPPRASRLCSRR